MPDGIKGVFPEDRETRIPTRRDIPAGWGRSAKQLRRPTCGFWSGSSRNGPCAAPGWTASTPDWLLSPSGTPPELRYQERDGFRLLDLANPDARRWAVDRVSRQIEESNIAIYRQDFNQYPAYFWQTGEPAEERGLREVRYITGLYAFLDELVRRHPGLILDNCASGGRRLDFEMMRRCVALWRSDSCWGDKTFPRNVQAMTHGLSHWLPLHGLGALTTDDVALRSGMGACGSFAINFRDPAAVTALRQHLDRYLENTPPSLPPTSIR